MLVGGGERKFDSCAWLAVILLVGDWIDCIMMQEQLPCGDLYVDLYEGSKVIFLDRKSVV